MTSNGSPLKGLIPDENTLESFQYALDMEADGLEFDICLSKDGIPVVVHPAILKNNNPSQFTLEQLRAIELPMGGKIPTLEEVLDFIAVHREETGKNITINAEFKGGDTPKQGIVDACYSVIAPYLHSGTLKAEQFVFNSFDWTKTAEIKAYDNRFGAVPVVLTPQLFEHMGKNFSVDPNEPVRSNVYDEILEFHEQTGGALAVDMIAKDLRPEFVDFCKEHGIGIVITTLYNDIKDRTISAQLKMLLEAEKDLPFIATRADDIEGMRGYIEDLRDEGSSPKAKPAVTAEKRASLRSLDY